MTPETKKNRFTFSYAERLHKPKDFKQVLDSGRRLVHPAILVALYKRNDNADICRLGLVTGRKLGIAAKRNRIKRRLREIFRLNKNNILPGTDLVFIPRKDAMDYNYGQLETIVSSLIKRAKFIK